MSTIEQLKEAVRKAQAAVDDYEIETTEDEYDDMLNYVYGNVTICGMEFTSAHALKELDTPAYRCGKNDWEDSLDKEDQADYRELVEALEEAQNELDQAEADAEDDAALGDEEVKS